MKRVHRNPLIPNEVRDLPGPSFPSFPPFPSFPSFRPCHFGVNLASFPGASSRPGRQVHDNPQLGTLWHAELEDIPQFPSLVSVVPPAVQCNLIAIGYWLSMVPC